MKQKSASTVTTAGTSVKNSAPVILTDVEVRQKALSWENRYFIGPMARLCTCAAELRQPFLERHPDETQEAREERLSTKPKQVQEDISFSPELIEFLKDPEKREVASRHYKVSFSFDPETNMLSASINEHSVPAQVKQEQPAMAVA